MDTLTNPGFIFKGFILLLTLLIFGLAVLFLKVRNEKFIKGLFADQNRMYFYSLGSALILFIVAFLIFIIINN